jgi:hypothetical protein
MKGNKYKINEDKNVSLYGSVYFKAWESRTTECWL